MEQRSAPSTPPPLAGGGKGEGAKHEAQLSRARALRRDSTPAERKLWRALRNRQADDLKFRRQVPLGPYIADFYCPSARLVVEVDGISHIDAPADAVRDAWMRKHGLRVLRISNHDVFSNLEGMVMLIELEAGKPPPPAPLPQGEGEFDMPPAPPHV